MGSINHPTHVQSLSQGMKTTMLTMMMIRASLGELDHAYDVSVGLYAVRVVTVVGAEILVQTVGVVEVGQLPVMNLENILQLRLKMVY